MNSREQVTGFTESAERTVNEPERLDEEKEKRQEGTGDLIDTLVGATESGRTEWERTGSCLAFSTKFNGRLYLISYHPKEGTKISVMDEKYDFVDMDEFTDSKILKKLYKKILKVHPEFKKQVKDCLNMIEEEEEEERLEKTIGITPELADKYDGRCFFDLDISDRIELVKFIKTPTGLDTLCIGCDYHWGYTHLYHDDYDDKPTMIRDTFCGAYIEMIEEGRWLMKETTQEVFDKANEVVAEMMGVNEELRKDFEKVQKRFREHQ